MPKAIKDKPTKRPAAKIDRQELNEAIEQLRPALAQHGGDIELVSARAGVVTVKLTGACAGCPMAQLTLRQGVEKFLVKRVKGVTQVKDANC